MFRKTKQPQVKLRVGKNSFTIGIDQGTKVGKEEWEVAMDVETAAELAKQINKGIFGMSRYAKKG